MERIVAIGEAAGGFLSSGGSVMTMRAFMARGWAAGRDCNACEKSCTTGHKLCSVSLWRGTLWRGSQEPRETRLKEPGTERRQSALRSLSLPSRRFRRAVDLSFFIPGVIPGRARRRNFDVFCRDCAFASSLDASPE